MPGETEANPVSNGSKGPLAKGGGKGGDSSQAEESADVRGEREGGVAGGHGEPQASQGQGAERGQGEGEGEPLP